MGGGAGSLSYLGIADSSEVVDEDGPAPPFMNVVKRLRCGDDDDDEMGADER
jgi:hypothetical protein